MSEQKSTNKRQSTIYTEKNLKEIIDRSNATLVKYDAKTLNMNSSIEYKCKCKADVKTKFKTLKYNGFARCKCCQLKLKGGKSTKKFSYNLENLNALMKEKDAVLLEYSETGKGKNWSVKYKCKCGNTHEKGYSAIRGSGAICEPCNQKIRFDKISKKKGKKQRYNKDELMNILDLYECQVLSKVDQKINRFEKMEIKCKCGEIQSLSFYNISYTGSLCTKCKESTKVMYYHEAPDTIKCKNCRETKEKSLFLHSQTTWKKQITNRCNNCRAKFNVYTIRDTKEKIDAVVKDPENYRKCNGPCHKILPHNDFIGENKRCIKCNIQGGKSKTKDRFERDKKLASILFPEMKLCKCGVIEPPDSFLKLFTTDTETETCRKCREISILQLDEIRSKYLEIKKQKGPCVDCNNADIRVLEFDHIIREDKENDVPRCGSIEALIKEADKCVMRCGICHAKRTKIQLNYGQNKKKYTDFINNIKCEIGGCKQCGWFDKDNLHVLQFDHIDRSTKLFNVSALASSKIEIIEEEIKKCQLLCVNCHKLKTIDQLGYYLYKDKSRAECRQEKLYSINLNSSSDSQ